MCMYTRYGRTWCTVFSNTLSRNVTVLWHTKVRRPRIHATKRERAVEKRDVRIPHTAIHEVYDPCHGRVGSDKTPMQNTTQNKVELNY